MSLSQESISSGLYIQERCIYDTMNYLICDGDANLPEGNKVRPDFHILVE